MKNADGSIYTYNESNPTKGYKQSWFKTPKSALKRLNEELNHEKTFYNREIIEAYCFTRSGKRF